MISFVELGMGIGDWGLGPIPNPQSPIPNPQSPSQMIYFIIYLNKYNKIAFYYFLNKLKIKINNKTIN